MPMLAGISVRTDLCRVLGAMLEELGAHETAVTIHKAIARESTVVGLTIPDREAILRVLDDPPVGLEELHGVLLREHEWRMRGLNLPPPIDPLEDAGA